MISTGAITSDIGSRVLRSGVIAVLDLIATANGKALGATFERTDKPAKETMIKILHDEGLETWWSTAVSSLLASISRTVTPFVPEQIAIIPGKLLGETWHWAITSHQSTNREKLGSSDGETKSDNLYAAFFDTFVKRPSDLALRICGLGEKTGNLLWYGISQLGLFSLGSFFLRNDEEENLPGVNIDSSESLLKTLFKGSLYTLVEQLTYGISQVIRFSIDFKDEFSKNRGNVLAKSIANVINERFLPGHLFLGVSSSLATYYFGKYIPKTTAAAIGEFPMSILNRVLNCRRRRSTKFVVDDKLDENDNKISSTYRLDSKGNKVWNYRFNESKSFNKLLDLSDSIFNSWRGLLIRGVAKTFKTPEQELISSLNMDVPATVKQQNDKKADRTPSYQRQAA